MKVVTAEFLRSCVSPGQYPPSEGIPELAFAGRSNVGKSSLINSVLYRRGLAKVSETPGKTRAVNFFLVTTSDRLLKHFYIVDLPGYGYAKVSKSARNQWGPMIEQYLTTRQGLRAVIFLVDARRVTPLDVTAAKWLSHLGRKVVTVVTKIDKLSWAERTVIPGKIRKALALPQSAEVVRHSARTHEGRLELLQIIRNVMPLKT